MLACKRGHLQAVQLIAVRYGIIYDYRRVSEGFLLHIAAQYGHAPVIACFKKLGFSLNQKNGERFTPLTLAVIHGHAETVQWLVENGARIHDADIHRASEIANPGILQYLIEKKRDETPAGFSYLFWTLTDEQNAVQKIIDTPHEGRCLVQRAAKSGQVRILEYLGKLGANFNLYSDGSGSPLEWAVAKGYFHAVKYLLEHGANINKSVLVEAIENRHLEIIQLLMEKKPSLPNQELCVSPWTLFRALRYAPLEIITLLITQINVRLVNNDGSTCLHYAAKNRDVRVPELILQMAPELLNRENTAGETPVCMAARDGMSRLIEHLIQKGARLEGLRTSPLSLALDCRFSTNSCTLMRHYKTFSQSELKDILTRGSVKGILFLIREKPDWMINLTTDGQEPLSLVHGLAMYRKYNDLHYLIGGNKDLGVRDKDGRTALHLACQHGKIEAVKFFLKMKPELLDATDKIGTTALMMAVANKKTEIVEYLTKNKADLNQKMHSGKYRDYTALHWAVEYPEIVKILLKNGAIFENSNYSGTEIFDDQLRLVIIVLKADLRVKEKGKDDYKKTLTFFGEGVNIGYSSGQILAAARALKRIVLDKEDTGAAISNTVLEAALLYDPDLIALRREYLGEHFQPRTFF